MLGLWFTTRINGCQRKPKCDDNWLGYYWDYLGKADFHSVGSPSRYTYDLIEITNDFMLTSPHLILPIKYRILALFLVGPNKFKAKGLTVSPGKKVKSPIIEESL